MKINKLIWIAIIVVLALGIGFIGQGALKQSSNKAAHHEIWYCPMHPQILYDHPGHCPICGMDLVQQLTAAVRQESNVKGYATVTVTDEQQSLIGLQTEVLQVKPIIKEIRAFGSITSAVDLYRTQNEFIDAYLAYVKVHKDYHRINDRQDAWGIHRDLQANVLEAKDKLLKLGLSDAQIAQLQDVSWNQVSRQPKILLFNNSRNYWVMAQIFEQDYPYVHEGQPVDVNISAYHTTVKGTVRSVGGSIDPTSRSVTALIELADNDRQLAANMLVDVSIPVSLGDGVLVPREAVMDTGMRKIVFVVKNADAFEPREIKTGMETDNGYEVTAGLSANERIVTGGNFLLDSESRVQAGRTNHG